MSDVRAIRQRTMRWLSAHRKAVSAMFVIVVFLLMIHRLGSEWNRLPEGLLQDLRVDFLVLSLLAILPAMIAVSLRWGLTLRALGCKVSLWRTTQIWLLSQAGRYVPGGIWDYVGRFYLGSSEAPRDAVAVSMLLEVVLRVVSEALVFAIGMLSLPSRGIGLVHTPLLAFGIAAVGGALLHPRILGLASQLPWIRNRWPGADVVSRLPYRRTMVLLLYYVVTVILVGIAFWTLVTAFWPMRAAAFPAVVGALAGSVVVGFLVPLAPNGWGVREGILALVLGQLMPTSVAVLVTIAARIWLTIADVVLIGSVYASRNRTSGKVLPRCY